MITASIPDALHAPGRDGKVLQVSACRISPTAGPLKDPLPYEVTVIRRYADDLTAHRAFDALAIRHGVRKIKAGSVPISEL